VTVIFVPPARGRKRRNCSSITAANSRSDIPACDVRLASRALETPLFGLFAHTHGQALSDGVQPAADVRLPACRTGPPRQDDKGRLERIFGVLMMTENTSAHAPDQ